MLEASKKLLAKYGEYGSISTKTTGMTEFKLKKIPARNGEPGTVKNTTKKNKTTKNKTRRNSMA